MQQLNTVVQLDSKHSKSYLLSEAATSSTASHASRASLEVAP